MVLNTESCKESLRKDKARVLLARFSLDGHDRGIMTVINALKNAGMEVVYIIFSDPKEIAKSAIEEDADIIGITSSIGQHLLVCSTLIEELRNNALNIPVIIGGVIPSTDIPRILNMGIKRVFGPGSTPQDVVSFIAQIMNQGSRFNEQ